MDNVFADKDEIFWNGTKTKVNLTQYFEKSLLGYKDKVAARNCKQILRGGKKLACFCPGVAFATTCHPMATGLISDTCSWRLCCPSSEDLLLQFLMNRNHHAIVHNSIVLLRNLIILTTFNIFSRLTEVARVWIVLGFSRACSLSATSFSETLLTDLGHNSRGIRKTSGPFHQNVFLERSFPYCTLDGKSAGLNDPVQNPRPLWMTAPLCVEPDA